MATLWDFVRELKCMIKLWEESASKFHFTGIIKREKITQSLRMARPQYKFILDILRTHMINNANSSSLSRVSFCALSSFPRVRHRTKVCAVMKNVRAYAFRSDCTLRASASAESPCAIDTSFYRRALLLLTYNTTRRQNFHFTLYEHTADIAAQTDFLVKCKYIFLVKWFLGQRSQEIN